MIGAYRYHSASITTDLDPISVHPSTLGGDCIDQQALCSLNNEECMKMSEYRPSILTSLSRDLTIRICAKLSYRDTARLRVLCRFFRDLERSEHYQHELESCGHLDESLSPLIFFWQDGGLEWIGFDSTLWQWDRLPSLRSLLPPRSVAQTTSLKDYLVATGGGMVCMDVSESRTAERIIVCNPVTRTKKELRPMNHRRRPVLMHIVVDRVKNEFHLIAAGSASAGYDSLSTKTEVYSSETGDWEVKGNIPGSAYSLNLFQSGVLRHGILYCLAIDDTHLIFAYDVNQGEWITSWRCPFPNAFYDLGNAGTNPQLILSGDQIVLFWEKSRNSPQEAWFCFATLNCDQSGEDSWEPSWSDATVHTRKGASGLDSYPEYVCSPSADSGRVNVLNTVQFTATEYDLESSGEQSSADLVPAMLKEDDEVLYTLNPLGFPFEPSYVSVD